MSILSQANPPHTGAPLHSSLGEFTMTIGGDAVRSPSTAAVLDPATGAAIAEAPECTREQMDAAMRAAERAFPDWRRDLDLRRSALRSAADALRADTERLARILTLEQGKPINRSRREITRSAFWFDQTADLQMPVEVVQDDQTARVEVRRKPMGVVAAITPWNFPMLTPVWKIAPALLAGNTVVLKPSPFTPLSALALGEILRDILPPGVLNVVSGGAEAGEWMTAHPIPRKITFTGSVATGKRVALNAAADLKRVTLELGGNDPAIVLPDVDAPAVAERLFWSAFENAGQVCIAAKRLYVHESQYGAVVDSLVALAESVRVGSGLEEETQLGPLNNEPQLRRVEELVEDARRAGARVVAGGRRLREDGYFYAPTIVSQIEDGVRLVDEEQFGPALPVIAYRSVEDAVERANRTHFGLGGSVWSSDPELGAEVAARLDSGTAWVNQHMAVSPQAPFGGVKWSGLGVEHGPWGLLAFTDIQVLNVAKTPIPRASDSRT